MSTDLDKEHEVFFRRMMIAFIVLMIIGFGALFFSSCKKKGPDHRDSAIVTANEAVIAQLEKIIAKQDSLIELYKLQDSLSQTKQSTISTSFKPIYEKINTDTGIVTQWNYLHVLLAETKRTPLTRD